MLGRTVGRYHIVAKLGEGGMGLVWKANEIGQDQPVAIKFLPRELRRDDRARKRFVREAQATAALDHPGIARLIEIGEWQGEPFIAVEFVDGETLAARIARSPMEIAEAVSIAADVASALQHAHARGVVHRDLTPRNIMISTEGAVRVIDFGLAFRDGWSRMTSSDQTLGTLHYMAPEALRGDRVDERADLYSLGVVLYETLSGTLPFVSDRPEALIYTAMNSTPTRPSDHRRGIPQELEVLVMRAMERDPANRPRSAAVMHAELQAMLKATTDAAGEVPQPSLAAADQSASGPPQPIITGLPRAKRLAIAAFRETSVEKSSDPVGPAFGLGLAEHLSAALAHDAELQVFVPNEVDLSAQDRRNAARLAGANLLIDGVICRVSGCIRVTFSLLDPTDGTVLGGGSVDGRVQDWFRIEDDLLESVTRALELHPAARRVRRLERPAAQEEFIRAAGHLQRGDDVHSVDAAIEIVERLLATESDSAVLQALRAKAFLKKFGLSKDVSWVHRAERACREALRLDPHSTDVLMTLARVLIRTGHNADAVDTLQQSLALQTRSAEAYQLLALAYEKLGRYDEAERAFRETIALQPGYWGAINGYGVLLFKQGKYAQARDQWQRVLELTPDNTQGIYNLAAAQTLLGDFERAAELYRRSIAVLPTATAWTGLGTVLFYLDHLAEAEEAFTSATQINPLEPIMWGNLADAERWMNASAARSRQHFDRAIELAREQLELNPENAQMWRHLALWLAKVGEIGDALRALERASALAPEDARMLVTAITVHLLAGDTVRAKECFARAWEKGVSRIELERDPELAAVRRAVVGPQS